MKSLYISLLLLSLLPAARLTAQTRMTEQKKDLTAIVQPRSDLNGKTCAVVKVAGLPRGATLAGSGIVGDVVKRDSVSNVYLATGTKYLQIVADTVRHTVIFQDCGIPAVQSGRTYLLRFRPAAPSPKN